jgi:MFS family permease
LSLGGIASLMPMLIAGLYGVDRVGAIYGKLNIFYGLGGLLAPWIAGILFVQSGGYRQAIYLAIALALVGAIVSFTVDATRRKGDA